MINIGKKIRLLRHEHAWSQSDVASQLDISIPAYSKIEAGITDMNLSRVEQIAAIFGMTTIGLLTLGEIPSPDPDNQELAKQHRALHARETELIALQERVIQLYEELRMFSSAK